MEDKDGSLTSSLFSAVHLTRPLLESAIVKLENVRLEGQNGKIAKKRLEVN